MRIAENKKQYNIRIIIEIGHIILAHSKKKCYYDRIAILTGMCIEAYKGRKYDFQKKDL